MGGPLKIRKMVVEVRNLIEIMECPARCKVALATFQFERETEFWWGTGGPLKIRRILVVNSNSPGET